jgi:hypothetical protein
VGQLSDPYEQGEDDAGIVISGLPGDPFDPDPPPAATAPDVDDDEEVPPEEGGSGDSLAYDLDDWSELERQAIADRLREAGVPHGWEDARLLIAAVDEAMVENVLDIVEGDADVPGTEPLDADRDKIAYDTSELDDEVVDRIVESLGEAGVAFQWGDGQIEEMYVYADDEEAVDAVFEAAQYPDELPAEDDEQVAGAATADLLGEVFVAADRLSHDVDDVNGTASLLEVAVTIDELAPPYGMGARDWERVCAGVGELSDLLVADVDADLEADLDADRDSATGPAGDAPVGDLVDPEVHDEKVRASARDLRSVLRPFV